MQKLTFDKIVYDLTVGLDYTPGQLQQISQWLLEYQATNQLTLYQLNELCWEDSDWIFSQIFD